MTLPQFWLRWIDDDDKKNHARTLLYEQIRAIQQHTVVPQEATNEIQQHAEFDDDFFRLVLRYQIALMPLQSVICISVILLVILSLCESVQAF